MKVTPFTDIHIALGAKMAEFAGYNMPIQYSTKPNTNRHSIAQSPIGPTALPSA